MLDNDLVLVIGIVLAALSIPALLAAFSESRPPRMGAVLLLVGCGLVAYALTQNPRGYTFAELPDVFLRVIGRLVN